MSAAQDLKDAVNGLATSVTNETAAITAAVADIQNLLTSNGVSQADAEAAVSAINTAATAIQSGADALNNAVNPPIAQKPAIPGVTG